MTTAPVDDALGGTASTAAPLLELTDVHMRLHGRDVLEGVSLSAPAEAVICLAGGNGAGKTTLLRIAAGVFLPGRGTVRVCGFDPVRDRRRFAAAVGFVTAGNDGIYGRLRVRENLELWSAIAYLPRSRRRQAIEAALDAFELRSLADKRADRLSLGQRQRIRLALGSLHAPRLLLFDEPHASLDDDGLELLSRAMEAHRARGGTVVWAAPSAEHAALPRDAVVTLEHGRRREP